MSSDLERTEIMVESAPTSELITRLRRIEGQVRGLQRMLEEGRECEDVLTQIMAVRSSIDQVGLLLMDHHIDTCLLGTMDAEASLRGLQRALRMWLRFGIPSSPDEEGRPPID
jgi:DNA-binding FrmR family transcriptional regulator